MSDNIDNDKTPTPDEEWAKVLKINFQPPKVPDSVPPVPENQPVLPENQPEVPESEPEPQDNQGRQPVMPENQTSEPEDMQPMPSTYLIWSILATVLCCFLPGIVAIVFSSQVSNKYFNGDIEGAKRASRMAEIWIIVSVVLGVVLSTLYIPFVLISA